MGTHVKYEDLTNFEVKMDDFPSFPALWGGNRASAGRGRKHQRNQCFLYVILGAFGCESRYLGGVYLKFMILVENSTFSRK